jgi:hypothetical protein
LVQWLKVAAALGVFAFVFATMRSDWAFPTPVVVPFASAVFVSGEPLPPVVQPVEVLKSSCR